MEQQSLCIVPSRISHLLANVPAVISITHVLISPIRISRQDLLLDSAIPSKVCCFTCFSLSSGREYESDKVIIQINVILL